MMIPDIKKILYATDLSPSARYAYSYAVSLASHYNATVTVFHSVEDFSPTALTLLTNYLDEEQIANIKKVKEQAALAKVRERLEEFCRDTDISCPPVEIVVKRGHPAEQILHYAKSGGFDVVVMGTHGHGLFEGAMMGSTARRVLRRSEKPVLVIRLPNEQD